jgi:anti-sigma B factor antagonist
VRYLFQVEPQWEVEVATEATTTVVSLTGTIDFLNAPELRQVLLDVVDAAGPSLIVDLTGVGFFESSALGALVATNRRCREVGGELALVLAENEIATLRVLRAGLGDVLSIFATVAQAQGAVADQAVC